MTLDYALGEFEQPTFNTLYVEPTPVDPLEGWDKVNPRFLTRSRIRWIKNGGRRNRLAEIAGGYLRARLSETSFFSIICPMIREGDTADAYDGGRVIRVVGMDSSRIIKERKLKFHAWHWAPVVTLTKGDYICGNENHAVKGKILSHWHCISSCSKAHKTEQEALKCSYPERFKYQPTPKQLRKLERIKHEQQYNHFHKNQDEAGNALTPDQVRLWDALSDISDTNWNSGWMGDQEFAIWAVLCGHRPPDHWCDAEQAKLVHDLETEALCWFTYESQLGVVRVTLEEWNTLYRAWREKTGGVIEP